MKSTQNVARNQKPLAHKRTPKFIKIGHLSPWTLRYSSALWGRFELGDDCFVNFGEKSAAIEFFRGRSLEIEVGVVGDAANDDGVSIVVVEIGVSGVSGVNNEASESFCDNSDASESCFSFFSSEYTDAPLAKNASKFFARRLSCVKVGLLTRISRSSRSRDDAGSACSLDEGRPNLPSDIFEIFDLKLFFFFDSNARLVLLSSALKLFSSTTLVLDLFIKSSAKDTLGLGSRRCEFNDERRFEFCRDSEFK
jgi:hypothetical protein